MSFWQDTRDLRKAIKANIDAGRGTRSLIEAVEQQRGQPLAPPLVKPQRHYFRTLAISALFGAMWRNGRR